MDIVNPDKINILEKIRCAEGGERLTAYFTSLTKKDLKQARDLINREDLSFTTLFLLRSAIIQLNFFQDLSPRNMVALEFIDSRVLMKKQTEKFHLSSEHVLRVHSVLKWMLETGAQDDGISDEFDEILDTSAAVLTREYRDRSVLPVISDMIFTRHKRGFFIHDIVWAFFESRSIKGLMLIGNRLLSEEPRDVELACSLLCFIPGIDGHSVNNVDKYSVFVNWMEENNLFLTFTGESFQLTGRPMAYMVNKEAKYLCQMVSVDTGNALKPFNQEECELLEEFKMLDDNEKDLLSGFSLAMYRKNKKLWDEWIKKPLGEQLRIARDREVYHD